MGAASKPAPASAPVLSRSRRFQTLLFCFTCCSVIRCASGPIDHVTGSSTRVLSAIDDHLAVDEHVVDAGRIKKRLFVRSAVLDFVEVEDNDVSPGALFDNAARIETHPRRRP